MLHADPARPFAFDQWFALLVLAGFSVLLAQKSDALSFGHVGIYTPVLLLAYLLAMRALFRYERDVLPGPASESAGQYQNVTLRRAIVGYALAAVVVVMAGSLKSRLRRAL